MAEGRAAQRGRGGAGPVLQGLARLVNDLPRGGAVTDIVTTVAVVVQAQPAR